jgi:hypothetical protein
MTADTHIKAEISLVGFWHNPYAQNAQAPEGLVPDGGDDRRGGGHR